MHGATMVVRCSTGRQAGTAPLIATTGPSLGCRTVGIAHKIGRYATHNTTTQGSPDVVHHGSRTAQRHIVLWTRLHYTLPLRSCLTPWLHPTSLTILRALSYKRNCEREREFGDSRLETKGAFTGLQAQIRLWCVGTWGGHCAAGPATAVSHRQLNTIHIVIIILHHHFYHQHGHQGHSSAQAKPCHAANCCSTATLTHIRSSLITTTSLHTGWAAAQYAHIHTHKATDSHSRRSMANPPTNMTFKQPQWHRKVRWLARWTTGRKVVALT